jgi:hypothetical protein
VRSFFDGFFLLKLPFFPFILLSLEKQVAAGFPLPPPSTAGGSSSWAKAAATTAPASTSSSSPSASSSLSWPTAAAADLTAALPQLASKADAALAAALDKGDAALAAALDKGDAARAAADAALAAKGLPTVSAAVTKHANASAAARAAAKGGAAAAAAKLRRGADAARRAADRAAANGTATLKSDAVAAAAQALDAAATAVDVGALVAGHALDRKAAKKAPRRTMTVAVALRLPGPFADGTGVSVVADDGPAEAGRRRRGLAQAATVPTALTPADAAALAAARAGPPPASATPPPDVVIDAPLVDAARVRDAVLGLLRARARALGPAVWVSAASLAGTVAPADAEGAVFAVTVSFRGDLAAAAALANAVNDVPSRGRACADWIDRVGFDFCGAVAAATPLVVNGVEVRGEGRGTGKSKRR